MKITYANPAPDEDMHPGEAVHWKDRGRRYFDYADLWFQQLDRGHVVDRFLVPFDQSPNREASEWMREKLVGPVGAGPLRRFGFITHDPALARKMLDRRIDFVADFKSGLFFFDLRGGHEFLMEDLLHLHTGKPAKVGQEALSYIDAGLGIFRSSQSGWVEVGEDTQLPTWAKLAKLNIKRRGGA